jgi:hypothetical protein
MVFAPAQWNINAIHKNCKRVLYALSYRQRYVIFIPAELRADAEWQRRTKKQKVDSSDDLLTNILQSSVLNLQGREKLRAEGDVTV